MFPGARVLEAGAGSGALSCWLLRAIGEDGPAGLLRAPSRLRRRSPGERGGLLRRPAPGLAPGRRRPARGHGVLRRPGTVRGIRPAPGAHDFDRIVLDMLAPWEHVAGAANWLVPGGLICCYVATTTQLSRVVEALRGHGGFDRAGRLGDDAPRLACGRTGGQARAPDGRPYRFPGDGTSARCLASPRRRGGAGRPRARIRKTRAAAPGTAGAAAMGDSSAARAARINLHITETMHVTRLACWTSRSLMSNDATARPDRIGRKDKSGGRREVTE